MSKTEKVRACSLIRSNGMTHTVFHRNQQIALVLIRKKKSWNTKLARELIAKYQ